MRVVLVSHWGEGAWFAHHMAREGHDVSVTVSDDHYKEALAGLVTQSDEINTDNIDLAVFDVTGNGELADEVRKEVPTIGDSELADRLEDDRIFALDFMQKAGVQLSTWEAFDDPADAIRFIKKTQKRYVFKPVGEQSDKSTTYVSKDAADMLRYFDVLLRTAKVKQFVLQEFVSGVEVSTQVYVNATGFYALNHTWELKRLLNDDLGPNTGCSASLVCMAKTENIIFQKGLRKLIEPLIDAGYVGPIDLNTIVNAEGIWGLELCPRTGYDADALLIQLLPIDYGEFLYAIATNERLPDLTPHSPYCASVRLSVPPYPTENLPAKFYRASIPIENLSEEDLDHWFIYDVRRRGESDDLETAGLCGWIGSPLMTGETVGEAFGKVYDELKRVRVPNGQYRTDCCNAISKRYWKLREEGYLK